MSRSSSPAPRTPITSLLARGQQARLTRTGNARATRLVIGELVENVRATQSSASAVRLLIAEKGAQYAEFVEVMNRLHAVTLCRLKEPDLSERIFFRENP